MTAPAYLMTRGRPRENRYDYQFIGAVPPARWWDAVTKHVQTTQREIVVARHEGGVGVYVTGVPSERRDAGGTPIRYTLVLDDLRDDPVLLQRIAALAWSADGYERLGEQLDKEFDADRIDAIIRGDEPAEDVPARTAAMLDSALEPAASLGDDPAGSWVGGVKDRDARRAFLARVTRLAAAEAEGWAFTSQAFGTLRGAHEAAADLRAPVAIMLLDPDGTSSIQEIAPGKGPALVKERRSRIPLIVGLSLAAVALILAIVWIMRSSA
ncbi:hypothetical protein [Paractinoplanes lichenicola]|uniref:Uncharacterized protein n=1 Tax=Paractinoplanes lichenicola TaxID=2802976 RepID=A0ABS1VMF6_9ACTN|nr:hypothetical protein [Actinoplanes lichenicola]MBL7255830.1 hypothetical protein [Actinoplanes lichenicola]